MLTRLLLLVGLLATSAHAQAADAPQPDSRRLRLATDSLEVYVVQNGQQKRTGLIVDRLDTLRVNGELVLRRVYRTRDAVLGSSLDTLVDAVSDLTPRAVRSQSSQGLETLDWGAGRVRGRVEENGKPARTIDEAVPNGGMYSSATFDLILRASPLADGYAITVPSFSGRQGWARLTAHVAGSESIPGIGGVWRIDADFAGMSVTFWITKTSRRLVRQVMRVAPGTEVQFVAPRGAAA